MSHFVDFMCQPPGDNEDFGSFIELQDQEMRDVMTDMALSFESPDLLSSEFFDSVLSMEQESFKHDSDNDIMNSVCSDFDMQSPRSSDSNDSLLHGSDSNNSTKTDDILNVNEVFSLSSPEPILEQDQIMFNPQPQKLVIQPNTKRLILTKPINAPATKGNKNKQQVIRVQTVNGNGRSLLLPVNVKNVKNIKIINAKDLKMENIKVATNNNNNNNNNHQQTFLKKAQIEKKAAASDDDDEDEKQDSRYPPLNLTAEEKRLLLKEGIKLPSHYPLTKNEEKELKRIRRKIRNKISAQDSRKRKKEYVDKLEEKAKRTSEENEFLKKRIKLLRKQNGKLMEQMRKLQAVLFNTTSTKATPTTCLMIVLFSTLLVCLPNIRLNDKQELGEQQLQFAARRALLFNQKSNNEEDVNMDEFLVFNKDEEIELEGFVDDDTENVTNNDNAFANFLSELARKYENMPVDKNCSEYGNDQGGGALGDFCRKYEDEIKNVINSMKEFLETDGTGVGLKEKKGFIEPDISDDEGPGNNDVKRNSIKEEPPSKRIKIEVPDVIYQEKVIEQDLLVNYVDAKQK